MYHVRELELSELQLVHYRNMSVFGQHGCTAYVVTVIGYIIYPHISEMYPRPRNTFSRYQLCLLIAEWSDLLGVL